MSVGAKLGVASLVLVLILLATGAWYVWKRPLRVFAWFNRRGLARAGLSEVMVSTDLGPQVYWTGGQGSVLVFVHGAGDESGTWSSVAAPLVSRYRLVIPDLAGHGRSAPATGPLSVGQVLSGFDAVMQHAAREPAVLVGNSLGAWVALLYARAHPDRVARLVLVNGGALKGDRPDLSLIPKTRAEAAQLMTQLRDARSTTIPGFVLDAVVQETQSGPIGRLAQTAAGMDAFLLDGRLDEIKAPVDLLWGESDKLFSLGYAHRMMAGLSASRLTVIPACGHVPHQECPSRFQTLLDGVLQQAPPVPAGRPPDEGARSSARPGGREP
jgi:pimeloyl-ACP methyl ester carboxylesterase